MWCDTARLPKIGPIDARVMLFMMTWALHMSWFTFKLAIFGVAAFSLLAWFGVSIGSAVGWINQSISGGAMFYRRSHRRAIRRSRL